MFRLLEPGNVIAVRLAARFLGWAVYSRKGYLEIEIGEEVERKKLNYGQIVSTVNTVQEVFQDINSIMQPETMQISRVSSALFMAGMMSGQDKPPLRVLSLDGGGVRGIAALMLLDEVMKKSHPGKLPYQVFDMIGGTSTGGFIAIMLGRMKMSVSECIQAYTEFMNVVFPPRSKLGSLTAGLKSAWSGNKWKAEPLVDVIKRLIKAKLGDPEKLLLFDPAAAATDDNPCKVFLMAVNQLGANNHAPVTLRTYEHPLDKPALPEIKLWEACRATSAAPSYFPPLEVSGVKFLDGGLQANNPLGWLWNEVLTVFGPARDTSCFLSIGTGTPESQVAGSATAGGLIGFAKSMASIATNTEMVNILFRSLINAFAPRPQGKKYWRFNIGDGCPDWIEGPDGVWAWSLQEKRVEMDLGELDDVAAMDKTVKATKAYIALDGAQAMISECAKALVVA
ncbi:acyl transferase/acyl hydrolase/lysophospholipase [Lasiosphaeria miniovina]|uniref:Acyl transferase/acyl hydrolase/lysophospholipase n=1 Tax=Lasiosphaeria miniovina TaxID=1954250 RepID=A0AA40AD83_9PEZI|nr:acyl transferase/acyl hydrolase/lysophospholipase [Lasiosphaeria miniovina]KAK0713548.1 acyl transferase/acyl hydrolase/lysophospholipase [Lasiosphaeria miniovina]